MRRAALLTAALAGASCHLLFSSSPARHRDGAAAIDASRDRGPDRTQACRPVSAPLVKNCAEQNPAGSAADSDLDGLAWDGNAANQDPWPDACNRLVFSEEFLLPGLPGWRYDYLPMPTGPVPCGQANQNDYCNLGTAKPVGCLAGDSCLDSAKCRCSSTATYDPADHWECGKVKLASDRHSTLTLISPPPLPDALYMVEIKVKLGKVRVDEYWGVWVESAVDEATGQHRSCGLSKSVTVFDLSKQQELPSDKVQPTPGPSMNVLDSQARGGGWWAATTDLCPEAPSS